MATKQKSSNDVEVFFSYSHKDEALRNELENHLSILKHQGVISAWHDRKIGAGDEWRGQIDEHLNSARVILLLISSDFMASKYCYDIEMMSAMERQKSGKARVIPVILRPVDWKGAPFSELQALPTNAEPVTSKSWGSSDEAFLDIAKGIRKAIESMNIAKGSRVEILTQTPIDDQRKPSPHDLVQYLKNDGCYLENSHFRLPSGKHSDSYIQVRIGMMDKKIRQAFATAMARRLSDVGPTMLAASTVGGILLAEEAAQMLNVPFLVGQQIAGGSVNWVGVKNQDSDSFSRVVLVDDILMTGGTLRSEIQSLREHNATIVAAVAAFDRSGDRKSTIQVDGFPYKILSLLQRYLNEWDPGNCPICPNPPINLYNAENEFIQSILSMPQDKVNMIIDGYREAYRLQQDKGQLLLVDQLEPFIPALFAGHPQGRILEDSALTQFIRLMYGDDTDINRKRFFSDLVGHLLAVSNIRVETRSLGCSILIGEQGLSKKLKLDVPIEVPDIKSRNFDRLIPFYDALDETKTVFLFNRDGELFGIKRLLQPEEEGETRGIQLLRQVTKETGSIGLVLRRKRKAIAVYRNGKLEAEAALSEKTGIWEFKAPNVLKEIISLIPSIEQTMEIVLEISREMVYKGYEGLFVIGDVSELKHEMPKIKMKTVPLTSLGVSMASEIAKLDGAMLISEKGEVQAASVIIKDEYDNEKGASSKGETAFRISNGRPDTAVVSISKNGTIEIFINGKSWDVSESISGFSR